MSVEIIQAIGIYIVLPISICSMLAYIGHIVSEIIKDE